MSLSSDVLNAPPSSPLSPLPPVFQAGSAHVRIRRDANEQLVLAHVTNRLLPLVSTLTVQIFKDDWTRPLLTGALSSPSSSAAHAEGYATHLSSAAAAAAFPPELDPLTSTPSKPSPAPPPEFSFDTPGRNVAPVVLPAHRPYGGLGLAYGPSPYAGMLNQGLARPGVGGVGGLGLGVQGLGAGFGMGVGGAGVQSYRTAFGGSAAAPLQFGAGNALSSQYRQYRP